MAIFHLATKTVARANGRSAVAAAAYRCGTRLVNERDGRAHDFRARSGVVSTFIAAPDAAPSWALDRQALWSAAEIHEKRLNAVTAREWEAALPDELDAGQREALAREFAAAMVERFGVVADCAIHAPRGDGDQRNHHLHMLTTTRAVGADGLGAKTRALDDRKSGAVEGVRALWEKLANDALAAARQEARIDRRSLAAQRTEAENEAKSAARSLNPIGKRQRVQRATERAEALSRAPTTHDGPERTAERRRRAAEDATVKAFTDHLFAELHDRSLTGVAVGTEAAKPQIKAISERAGAVFVQLQDGKKGASEVAEKLGRAGVEVQTHFQGFMAPPFGELEPSSPLRSNWREAAMGGNFAPLLAAVKHYAKTAIGQARFAVAMAFAEHEAPQVMARRQVAERPTPKPVRSPISAPVRKPAPAPALVRGEDYDREQERAAIASIERRGQPLAFAAFHEFRDRALAVEEARKALRRDLNASFGRVWPERVREEFGRLLTVEALFPEPEPAPQPNRAEPEPEAPKPETPRYRGPSGPSM